MKTNSAETQHEVQTTAVAELEVDQMIEQIWCELAGRVGRETIQQVVSDVAQKFQDATVLTYVPIFVRQDALRELTGRN